MRLLRGGLFVSRFRAWVKGVVLAALDDGYGVILEPGEEAW